MYVRLSVNVKVERVPTFYVFYTSDLSYLASIINYTDAHKIYVRLYVKITRQWYLYRL